MIAPHPTYKTHIYCSVCGIWVKKEEAELRCSTCNNLYRTSKRNNSKVK